MRRAQCCHIDALCWRQRVCECTLVVSGNWNRVEKKCFSCKLSEDSKLHALPPWGASGRLARFKIHNFKLQRSNKLHTRAREERITSTCTTRPSRTVNTPIGPIQRSKLQTPNELHTRAREKIITSTVQPAFTASWTAAHGPPSVAVSSNRCCCADCNTR